MTLLKRLFGGQTRGDEPHVRLFLETMLIMIAADGSVDDKEMRRFMAQVRAHPQLSHLSQRMIDKHLQEAFVAIRREGLEQRIVAISKGLRRRDQRLAAVGMAMSIASGDGQMSDEELAVLGMLQGSFELTEDDLAAAASAARDGSLDSFMDEDAPVEQYYIEAMMLMAAADGDIDPAELDKFGQELAHQRHFDHVTPEQAGVYMERSLNVLETEGLEARLTAIAAHLTTDAQRQIAFELVVEMCLADGNADPQERALLKLFQERLGLSDDFVSKTIRYILEGRR